ncbi:MAG: KpsF/GutQ family sugar-phosphate isomerase [Proteobacteria bacterium]|nr:KpsF/GutQ family sugar-phosphate isomerase [Pseudomonadota bacterium]
MSKKHTKQEQEKLLALGRAVISTETEALENLLERIDENFVQACLYILDCKGRVVVLGMGKSGHIGSKIAATLSSTGSPAFFVHPGEASHGDLGMIKDDDVVLALSNSGETDEIITLLPVIKRLGVPLITLTGNADSMLAKTASVNIDVGVEKEACPLGLTPTASTTAALAMGDALAIALLEARGFGAEDFAIAHPGGMLGRRLLLHVGDIMHGGEELPAVLEDTLLSETLLVMTQMGLGSAAIIDEENCVLGVFTDGDLRRALDNNIDVHKTVVSKVMTRNYKSINKDCLAAEALAIMEDNRINALPVVNAENKLIGLLNMHDLLRARVV